MIIIRNYSINQATSLVQKYLKSALIYKTDKEVVDKIKKYHKLLIKEIINGLNIMTDEQALEDELPISSVNLHQKSPTVFIKGAKTSMAKIMQQVYPVYLELNKGSNFKGRTIVKIRNNMQLDIALAGDEYYDDIFIEEFIVESETNAINDVNELGKQLIENFIELDKESMRRFIVNTRKEIQVLESARRYVEIKDEKNAGRRIKMQKYYRYAALLFNMASRNEKRFGTFGIKQLGYISDFGRLYYKGINMQSAPSVVREAALGDCYKFDIDTCAFAWRYNTAKLIDEDRKFCALLEYIEDKNFYRKHIADIAFNNHEDFTIATVKKLLSAISFGASFGKSGAWKNGKGQWEFPICSEIIKKPETRTHLEKDPWFNEFLHDCEAINEMIFKNPDLREFFELKSKEANLRDKSGRLNRSKCIAFLYQTSEKQLLDAMTAEANRLDPNNVILTVHDAFYTKVRPSMVDTKEALNSTVFGSELMYTISEEKISRYKDYESEEELELFEHRKMTDKQEEFARLYNQAMHEEWGFELLDSTRGLNSDEYAERINRYKTVQHAEHYTGSSDTSENRYAEMTAYERMEHDLEYGDEDE